MALSFARKVRSMVLVALGGSGVFAAVNIYNGNDKFYSSVIMPVVHMLDPERAHQLGIIVNKYRLIPKSNYVDPDTLKVELFGMEFSNPVGIAAGYDKHGEAVMGLYDIGFGFVEVGSVTPLPQRGGDKPRVFRLPMDNAVINRYGFNSEGHKAVFERLQSLKRSHGFGGVVGVNLGKNKTSPDPIADYVKGIKKFASVADYYVINISSPNTPGLRDMQSKDQLSELLKAVVEARNKLPQKRKPPLFLKLAPDLSFQERQEIAGILKQTECKVDGLIISNTTTARPKTLKNADVKNENGGLSGEPLRDASTQMIADMYKLTDGMPIIGVGGIFSGKDAYQKIKAGASMVQLYTALIYGGPPVVTKIKKELAELLAKDGYRNIAEAVGKDVKK